MKYKFLISSLLLALSLTNFSYAKEQLPKTESKLPPVSQKLFASVEATENVRQKRKYVTIEEFQQFCKKTNGKINKIYLHWTAHNHKRAFRSYHINITGDGKIILTCKNLADNRSHTWKRNLNAVGVSLCGCLKAELLDYKADPPKINWGKYPPTQAQINTMAQVVAVMAEAFDIPITKDNIMTHYEAALIDKYAPGDGDPDNRWDLISLVDPALTDRPVPGGELIRAKASWYRAALISHYPKK